MDRTGAQHLLHSLSGDDWHVLFQPSGYQSVQLLVLYLGGHHGVAARCPLSARIGLLPYTAYVFHAVGAAGLHAHLLLCPQGLEELLEG